ncbi:spore gernimation protein GerQ [Gorillibacterium sp. sgz5001074]|uniref:spore gernimation protein GerQ n=1 Tax=Gorillibacterium sp. sgz5001074 TaxID=3446695 RepID=UPI003F662450
MNHPTCLAPHEAVDIHEVLNFKTLCLAKSAFMQGLVFDQELKALLQKDVQMTTQDIAALQALYEKAPFRSPVPESRPVPTLQ